MKKISVVGVGAIGGFIGALIAESGRPVNAIARGATLEALIKNGLQLQMKERVISVSVTATDNPEELGPQDLVIIAVKSQSMPEIAQMISPLLGPDTIVLTAMNGVPWWFFERFKSDYAGMKLTSVDPEGKVSAAIPIRSIVGAVVHGSFVMDEPGVIRQIGGKKLIIGESGGGGSSRVDDIARLLREAGLDIEISETIQNDIWFKLWGNMTMNPVSGLTGATCDRILDDPLVSDFCLKIMAEAAQIGERIGCPVNQSGEERNAVTRELGAFKTSMLKDVEKGRSVELDALVSSVREIGAMIGVRTPHIDTLLGLTRLHARVRGLYPDD